MRAAVVQYDDRAPPWAQSLVARNAAYAQAHGYIHVYWTRGWGHLPPYWRKVFIVRELLPAYDVVVWCDSDAAIVSGEPLDAWFAGAGAHMVFSSNPAAHWLLRFLAAPMCAGVWAVRNTPEGRSIMDAWAGAYDARLWHRAADGTWHAPGPYGGVAYEQGAFHVHVLHNPHYAPWLRQYAPHVLNHLPRPGAPCPRGVRAVHYWSGWRELLKQQWGEAGAQGGAQVQ